MIGIALELEQNDVCDSPGLPGNHTTRNCRGRDVADGVEKQKHAEDAGNSHGYSKNLGLDPCYINHV